MQHGRKCFCAQLFLTTCKKTDITFLNKEVYRVLCTLLFLLKLTNSGENPWTPRVLRDDVLGVNFSGS